MSCSIVNKPTADVVKNVSLLRLLLTSKLFNVVSD